MMQNLVSAMKQAVHTVAAMDNREVILVHHNDTDGLSSGAITMMAFNQCGFTVHRFSLEKPYPQVLERILSKKDRIVVFADFAGRIAPLISAINQGRNLVLILDHHPAVPSNDPKVYNLDGDLYGLKGDRDISASATCYLFAEQLMHHYGLDAEEFSALGALGAIGDGFLVNGALAGVNREIMHRAVGAKLMKINKSETDEQYQIKLGESQYEADSICTILDTIGGVGYYDDGPAKGVDICCKGLDASMEAYAGRLATTREQLFNQEIKNLNKQLHNTAHLQWFDLENRFIPMGIKMVGVFCTMIKDQPILDSNKYLAGFQYIPDMVPGFGPISFGSTKISMRVSKELTRKIRSGEMPGLDQILPQATEMLGGFVDACHSLSAATTVKIGQEQDLVNNIETILRERMAMHG